MKRRYQSPRIAVERFTLTQVLTSCSAVKINYTTAQCVYTDPDATPGMREFALNNGFLNAESCLLTASDEEGLCYHTSASMAFTS